nr:MFS transporter [Chloroflexota bacterium]
MKLSRDLRFLGLALFLWASGEGMFIYILPLYMQSLGADSVKIGLLYSLGAVTTACTLIPAGLITDRLGPNAALISGWLVGVVAGVLMAFARDMTWFTVGWLLYAAATWVTPAIAAYAARGRGDLPTERAITSVSSMYHAGLIVAPAVGGW